MSEEELDEEPSSRGELRRQMGDALTDAGITEERRQEVLNALEIGDTRVEEIMNPREEIYALSTEDDLETNVARIGSSPHVRFPLVSESLEDFVGIIYTPAVFRHVDKLKNESLDLTEIAAPPMTVSTDTMVSDLIDQFQAENQELALVFDDGQVVGLVTATDAFEAITGELKDPLDKQLLRSA